MRTQAFKEKLDVHLYVTPQCHLACTHCYYDAWSLDRAPEDLLTIEEIASVLETLSREYDVDVHLEGGEAFLRVNLGELFPLVSRETWRKVTITTSGSLRIDVPPSDLRQLGCLRISVEGHTDELQRRVRGVPLAPVLKTCAKLADAEVPYTLRITLFEHSVSLFSEMVRFYLDSGCSRFSFFECQPVGRAESAAELAAPSPDQFRVLLQDVGEVCRGKELETLRLSFPPSRSNEIDQARPALELAGVEVATIASIPNLTVNSNGDLGVSPWRVTASRTADCFGNLRDVDLSTELRRRMGEGLLVQPCSHTSAYAISFGNGES